MSDRRLSVPDWLFRTPFSMRTQAESFVHGSLWGAIGSVLFVAVILALASKARSEPVTSAQTMVGPSLTITGPNGTTALTTSAISASMRACEDGRELVLRATGRYGCAKDVTDANVSNPASR